MARVLTLLLGVTIVAAFLTLIFHLILTDLEEVTNKQPHSPVTPTTTSNLKVIRPKEDESKYKVRLQIV